MNNVNRVEQSELLYNVSLLDPLLYRTNYLLPRLTLNSHLSSALLLQLLLLYLHFTYSSSTVIEAASTVVPEPVADVVVELLGPGGIRASRDLCLSQAEAAVQADH